jgi:hypothetical protein
MMTAPAGKSPAVIERVVAMTLAECCEASLRSFAETSYRAKSWMPDRRARARIEDTTKALDIRFVVTNIETDSAEEICERRYCARG